MILDALGRLAEQVRLRHPAITLLALFGSVARLEPGPRSDTDLLVLLDLGGAADPRAREDQLAIEPSHTITDVAYPNRQPGPLWGLSLVTSNSQASDLDADFLSVVGEEGVLLYRQEDAPPPPPLERLTPFVEWAERVEALLTWCQDRSA